MNEIETIYVYVCIGEQKKVMPYRGVENNDFRNISENVDIWVMLTLSIPTSLLDNEESRKKCLLYHKLTCKIVFELFKEYFYDNQLELEFGNIQPQKY